MAHSSGSRLPGTPLLNADEHVPRQQAVSDLCQLAGISNRQAPQNGPSLRLPTFVLDGEAVLLGVDGRSDFDRLHSCQQNDEVQFYAFDTLANDGDDLRKLPLSMRQASLLRLLARQIDGIFPSDFEQGGIGPDLFRHACLIGLEGLVSKRSDWAYRSGVSPNWVKIKNPAHPAMQRVRDAFR